MRLRRLEYSEDTLYSLDNAKLYLRVDHDDEDSLIKALRNAATSACEDYCKRSFLKQKFQIVLDKFPENTNKYTEGVYHTSVEEAVSGLNRFIKIPRGNVISISEVRTIASDNTSTVFSSVNYYLDNSGTYPRLILNDGAVWPTDLRDYAAVEVDFFSGYSDDKDDVPENIISAVKMVMAHFYEKRGDEDDGDKLKLPKIVKQILSPYKVFTLG